MKRTLALTVVLVLGALTGPALTEDDFLRPIGRPPKAKPQMRQGGEALPPLPLPATPLRRSEKKRPPSPATLIGKVVWGSYLDYKWEDGRTTRVYDWNMVPADCQALLRTARATLNMEYRVETTTLSDFSSTPAEIPILYFSGGRSLKFSPADRERLRRYLLAGGTVLFDSVVGSPFFYKSAVNELARILPEAQIRRLPEDHPVFHMVTDTLKLRTKRKERVRPILEGAYIGSRVAAFVSPYGLGAGWDRTFPTLIKEAEYYVPASASRLGINLLAYAVGYFQAGLAHARIQTFDPEDLGADSDPVVFAQIQTDGVWNTEPGGAHTLLRFMRSHLNMQATYRLQTLRLDQAKLGDYPFLYLSGLSEFTLSQREGQALKRYLDAGGFLIIDNSLGLGEFRRSVYRELAKLYPRKRLTRLASGHPLFTSGPFKSERVRYTPAAETRYPGLAAPYIEALDVGSEPHVFFSPFDLAAGWQGDDHPLSLGYAPADALRLGANLITYCLTH